MSQRLKEPFTMLGRRLGAGESGEKLCSELRCADNGNPAATDKAQEEPAGWNAQLMGAFEMDRLVAHGRPPLLLSKLDGFIVLGTAAATSGCRKATSSDKWGSPLPIYGA